jgi:hypothetical protein
MGYVLERGDLVFTAGKSTLAKLIRAFQRPPTERYPAHVNHVAIVHQRGRLDEARIFEWDREVREGRLVDYHRDDRVWVYRPRNITSGELDYVLGSIAEKWRRAERYGYFEFITQAIDNAIPGSPVLFRRLNLLIPGAQCSTGTATLLWDVGLEFGEKAWAATPFDMASWCDDEAARPEPPMREYERIAAGIKPSEWMEAA